jgi:hypothetical protein
MLLNLCYSTHFYRDKEKKKKRIRRRRRYQLWLFLMKDISQISSVLMETIDLERAMMHLLS